MPGEEDVMENIEGKNYAAALHAKALRRADRLAAALEKVKTVLDLPAPEGGVDIRAIIDEALAATDERTGAEWKVMTAVCEAADDWFGDTPRKFGGEKHPAWKVLEAIDKWKRLWPGWPTPERPRSGVS